MQTLSVKAGCQRRLPNTECQLTDVVSLVKYDDRVLAHLFRHLLSDFRVQEVVERVDDDGGMREL